MSLTPPSVLAFERKISCSDALMYSGSWNERHLIKKWIPIPLQHKDIRGTISNYNTKLLKIEKANLQSIDIASIPFGSDTLRLEFTMKILGNIGIPNTCNEQNYQGALSQKVESYIKETNCRELALRYAENIANGRFLWRNRLGAEEIEVKVSQIINDQPTKTWVFRGYDYSLKAFSGSEDTKIQELAQLIQQGFCEQSFIFLKIEAFARVGQGQEVFPSQEFIRDSGKQEYKKSKVLYIVEGTAALHSQKIGNAIRTIDTWYPSEEEVFPIPIEPYGTVTNRSIAYRAPQAKADFYSLLNKWVIKDDSLTLNDQHYVVACLIRGGVFSMEKESNKEKKAKDE